MLTRSLSDLLFFSVERHLDFRQGKLNASLEIGGSNDRRERFPQNTFDFSRRFKKYNEALHYVLSRALFHQVLSILNMDIILYLRTSDFFVAGGLVHRSLPLRSFADFADKGCHSAR